MAEEMVVVPIKGMEMQTDKGQGAITLTIGPMTEKTIRKIAAAAAGGKLKVVIGPCGSEGE